MKRLAKGYTGPRAAAKKKGPRADGLRRLKKLRALGDGDGLDWSTTVEQLLKSLDMPVDGEDV